MLQRGHILGNLTLLKVTFKSSSYDLIECLFRAALRATELHKELHKFYPSWQVVWDCGQRFGMFTFLVGTYILIIVLISVLCIPLKNSFLKVAEHSFPVYRC